MPQTRILFVDDERNVLEGLHRMLRKQRGEWDMTFVGSTQEALTLMEESPFDVVMTDMQMPGMGGAEFLQHIIERWPNTTRIVLSGHGGEHCSHQAVKLAHQFLSKPTDADAITQTVSRTCAIQKLVCNEKIRTLAGSCNTLPSLPDLYIQLTDAVHSENADAKAIADIIRHDMAMSAKLLQLVNSSFFGIGRQISSIRQAVTMLGTTRIKALVLSEHVFKEFKPARPIPGFSMTGFWQHSLTVAEAARLISKRENQRGEQPEQAFTAGLLHDIGILMLASKHPDGFEEVIHRSKESSNPPSAIEEELFGTTHGEIGAYLLGLWALPAEIAEAAAYHHKPCDSACNGLCTVAAAHTADALVSQVGPEESVLHGYPGTAILDKTYLERIGMADRLTDWEKCSCEVCERQMAVV